MKKVYLFYIKKTKELYAYTLDKELKNIFLSQRNPNVFKVITEELEDVEYQAFSYKEKSSKLIKDYLYDGEKDYEIVTTVRESDILSDSCSEVQTNLENLRKELQAVPWNKNYLNTIIELTELITYRDKNNPNILPINTFRLFYHLFKTTFYQSNNQE